MKRTGCPVLSIAILAIFAIMVTWQWADATLITENISFAGSTAANAPTGGTLTYDDAAITGIGSETVSLTTFSASSPYHMWTLSNPAEGTILYTSGVRTGEMIMVTDQSSPPDVAILVLAGSQWILLDVGTLDLGVIPPAHGGSPAAVGTYTLTSVPTMHTPEPGTLLLLASGVLGLFIYYRCRQ